MGLQNAPSTPLSVSAREFDLGRPDVQAPNVQALADAVRQGYIGASEIQQRALAHPTLVAEAEAGPKLVQAKLAAAQAETAPAMLEAKATAAQAQAQKLQAEAEIADQMRRLGEEGRNQLTFLRSKGVVVSDLSPESLAQQYKDYRNWETDFSLAKAMQERAVKRELRDHPAGGKELVFTSNGFQVSEAEEPQLNSAAKSAADWLTLNRDFQTWHSRGKTPFDIAPGATTAPQSVRAPDWNAQPAPLPGTPAPAPAPAAPAAPAPTAEAPGSTAAPVFGGTVFPPAKKPIPGEEISKMQTAETAARGALKMSQSYMDLVASAPNAVGPLEGRVSKAILRPEWDSKVARFKQDVTSLLAPVAKGIFNETGVLSDKDVARYEGVFPSLQDTPQVGMQKLAAITKIILDSYANKATTWSGHGYDAGQTASVAAQLRQGVEDFYKAQGLDLNSLASPGVASALAAVSGKKVLKAANGKTYIPVPGPNGSVSYQEVQAVSETPSTPEVTPRVVPK